MQRKGLLLTSRQIERGMYWYLLSQYSDLLFTYHTYAFSYGMCSFIECVPFCIGTLVYLLHIHLIHTFPDTSTGMTHSVGASRSSALAETLCLDVRPRRFAVENRGSGGKGEGGGEREGKRERESLGKWRRRRGR